MKKLAACFVLALLSTSAFAAYEMSMLKNVTRNGNYSQCTYQTVNGFTFTFNTQGACPNVIGYDVESGRIQRGNL